MTNPKIEQALQELEYSNVISLENNKYQTTRRWQAAMARASFKILQDRENVDGSRSLKEEDVRLPVIYALKDIFKNIIPNDRLVPMVASMVWIEAQVLGVLGNENSGEFLFLNES